MRNNILQAGITGLLCIYFFSNGFVFSVGPEVMSLPRNWAVTGAGGMVAAANPHAARAGREVLLKGGSAADAILAMQWALNVVEPQSSGIGGGGFIVYYDAKSRKVFALDGREESPEGLTINDFKDKNGKLQPFYPDRITSTAAVGVPGTVSLLTELKKRFGSNNVSYADTFAVAIELAEKGFRVSSRMATALAVNEQRFRSINPDINNLAQFFPGGQPLKVGEVCRQKRLASTFRLLAKKGQKVFYQGEIAGNIVKALNNINPSQKIKAKDLARYVTLIREPAAAGYHGYTVYSMPPPSSGYILLQSLKLREAFMGRQRFLSEKLLFKKFALNSANGLHLKLETEKLAFADREVYIADPDFALKQYPDYNPSALLNSSYIEQRSRLIHMNRAMATPVPAGNPPGLWDVPQSNSTGSSEQTTHLVAVDKDGNVASFTSTIEHSFGSAIIVPEHGFFLNNELTDFTFEEGSLNAPSPDLRPRKFVLNAEGRKPGGKRPRSSMSPVIVFKDGEFVLAVGAPGGTTIPGSITSVLIGVLDDGLDVQSAINRPRMMQRNRKEADAEFPFFQDESIRRNLEHRGHTFAKPNQWNVSMGGVQAIHQYSGSKILWGGADLRREGRALPVKSSFE